MKKILVSLTAAGVLVAGVATTAVITGSSASAQEAPSEEAPPPERPERGAVIEEVLNDLVSAGEISLTDAEIDVIMQALQEKWEELKADRPEGRGGPGHHRGFRGGARFGFHLAELLEDGIISEDELAELPEDHPFNDPDGPFADVAPGGITEEELQGVLEQLREEHEGRFGLPFGEEAPDVEGTNV